MSKTEDDELARTILNAFHGKHRELAMNPVSKLEQIYGAVNTVLESLLQSNWMENTGLIFPIMYLSEARKELELAIELENEGADPNLEDKIDVAKKRVNELISNAFCLNSPQGNRTGLKAQILIKMAELLINSGENGESQCKTPNEAATIVGKSLGIARRTAVNAWKLSGDLTPRQHGK